MDLGADTLGFTYALPTGSVVRYIAPAGSEIGGLESGREYNVLNVPSGQPNVPSQKIRLGNAFDAAGAVNALNDTITFAAPHNFKSGDAVIYNAAGGVSIVQPWQTELAPSDPSYVDPTAVLYVRGIPIDPSDPSKIDPFTIKLARSFAEATGTEASLLKDFDAATQVNASTDRITIAGQTFQDGQAVTYRAPAAAQFGTEQVDVVVQDTTITDQDGNTYASQEFVRTDNNIIYLAGHGFATGDALTYHTVGIGPSIGGLTDGQTYYAIKVDADRIRLADSYLHAWGQLAFDDRGNDNPDDDILAVPQTALQLAPVPSAVTTSLTFDNRVVTASVTFARRDSGDTIMRSDGGGSWLADGFKVGDQISVLNTANNNGTFTIAGVDATTLTLTVSQFVTTGTANATVQGGDTISRSDAGGSWVADGFKVGDAIKVSGTVNNNGTFTIAGVDATTLTLTLTNVVPAGTVNATVRDADHTNTHSLSRNLKNLEDGVTYYVIDSNTADGTFGLAATRGGSAIQIDAHDDVDILQRNGAVTQTIHPVTRGGTHLVGTVGIDLQAGAGTQTLYIDLSSQPASLAGQRLLGAGGVPLNSISPPAGDGLSGASARGGSGGVGDFAFPAAGLTASPNVTASVAGGQSSIVAAGSVSIVSIAQTGVKAYGDTAGGGGISIGEAHADTLMTGLDQNGKPTDTPVSTLAQVGDGVSITAGGDFALTADSDHDVAAIARSAGGGIISGKIAETTAKLNYATRTVIGAGASVVSDK
ncbi:MAG TPA: hypothetical protein VK504_17830, partial [Vicinamibacterales bacterium]|nr:hypothetical protein [Vicinamibacterales bacterium]